MAETLEVAAASQARGRPSRPVRNKDTGEVFGDCDKAVDWLASIGCQVLPQTLRNRIGDGVPAGGFRWEWAAPAGKPGPMKGCGGRPPKDGSRPVNLVPRTPVVDSDGNAYPDAEVAAGVMRLAGSPAESKGIVAAIGTGEAYAGRRWDWKGRGLNWCATEQRTGVKCEDCAARVAIQGMLAGLQL